MLYIQREFVLTVGREKGSKYEREEGHRRRHNVREPDRVVQVEKTRTRLCGTIA